MTKTSCTIDWTAVEKFIAERQPTSVDAGLLDDWFFTAATIYKNGKWLDRDQAYTHSIWAAPGFKATLPNGDVVEVACPRLATAEDEAEWARQSKENSKKMRAYCEETRAESAAKEASK